MTLPGQELVVDAAMTTSPKTNGWIPNMMGF